MSTFVVHPVSEIPYYEGEGEIPGIRFRSARQTLGVSAWGMNVLDIAAGCDGYPEHDHKADGQEEVYVVLSGRVELHAAGEVLSMQTGDMVRVPPNVTRKFVTTDADVRILALGGTPGQPYTAGPGM